MNGPIERATAAEYALWFKTLADATRIQIVSLLARRGGPMSVGEIVAAVEVGQSTVSRHLQVLAEVRFVLVERRGTASFYRINEACVSCFPSAADVVMGRPVPTPQNEPNPTPRDEPVPAAKESPMREDVIRWYSRLAEDAREGLTIVDCDPDAFAKGCFGPAGYNGSEDVGELPDGAVRASLGCGNPVAVADINPGETVLDLGSGGGIDVLLSARRAGPTGKAYGLDGSAEMIELARANARQAGAENVEFLHGHIEAIPLPESSVDVVISNCVINLSADKARVLAGAFRVLRPGGRLGVSDVIAADGLTEAQRSEAERRIGSGTGSLTADEYRGLLRSAGFIGIRIMPINETGFGMLSAIVQAVRPGGVAIRPMRAADAGEVLAIYQEGLDSGDASFETEAPSWAAFDSARLARHRFVATDPETGRVLGWIAATQVSSRCVYSGVVEHSIYVGSDTRGRGVAKALLDRFIESTEKDGIWTIQSGIFPENTASLELHEKAGFRRVGVRERVGRHPLPHGRWRDVVFLERRSLNVT